MVFGLINSRRLILIHSTTMAISIRFFLQTLLRVTHTETFCSVTTIGKTFPTVCLILMASRLLAHIIVTWTIRKFPGATITQPILPLITPMFTFGITAQSTLTLRQATQRQPSPASNERIGGFLLKIMGVSPASTIALSAAATAQAQMNQSDRDFQRLLMATTNIGIWEGEF